MTHTTIRDVFNSVIPITYLRYGGFNTDVIITAPHGGGIKPLSIPRRKYGISTQDTYTRRITEDLLKLYGETKPHHIIADIHRSRVDLNRDVMQGAENNYRAEAIWKMWHSLLQKYITNSRKRFDRILYVDIHSHNNNNSFQLGYNLEASRYLELKTMKKTRAVSTFDSLGFDKYEMVFGESSFKVSLENMGFSVYNPIGGETYFNGGYNIETYSGGGVGGIQIEVPVSAAETYYMDTVRALKYSIERFRSAFIKQSTNSWGQ